MRNYRLSKIIFFSILLIVITIILWTANLRTSDYKQYHYKLAKNSVANVSDSINQFINNRKRLMLIFANENISLIKEMIANPEDQNLKSLMDNKIKGYFPKYFTYTIADNDGVLYYDDFEGYVGDLCITDLKIFSQKNINLPRVHPNSFRYHYDLMANFFIAEKKYIIFISFSVDDIALLLKNTQAVGHKTVLVQKQNQHLLEITEDGARNRHFRKNYRLTENELSYLLYEHEVKGSSWFVYDFYEPQLFSEYENKVYTTSLIIILMITVIGILFYFLIKKEEIKRKKAEAVKSEFVTVISHELRTPLTSIGGAIKLIENGVFGAINDDIKKYLNIASNNIDRLTNIVNDILDVKKMEAGEFQLDRKNISLVDIVELSIKDNSEYANNFNTELDFIKPEKDYIVYGDEGRLLQVMSNLLSNAIKYGAQEDCIKIYFNELTNSIRLNVEDHGKGIHEKNKNILFEKFTQSHSRDTEVVKGTGLGLNIVKSIIESHDGMVSYEAGKEKGTIFYILLPLVK